MRKSTNALFMVTLASVSIGRALLHIDNSIFVSIVLAEALIYVVVASMVPTYAGICAWLAGLLLGMCTYFLPHSDGWLMGYLFGGMYLYLMSRLVGLIVSLSQSNGHQRQRTAGIISVVARSAPAVRSDAYMFTLTVAACVVFRGMCMSSEVLHMLRSGNKMSIIGWGTALLITHMIWLEMLFAMKKGLHILVAIGLSFVLMFAGFTHIGGVIEEMAIIGGMTFLMGTAIVKALSDKTKYT